MAAFRTLILSGCRNHNPRSRLSSSHSPHPPAPLAAVSHSPLSPAVAVSPNPLSLALRLNSAPSPLFLPRFRWIGSSGPLFLPSSPSQLKQLATPLILRGKDAIFRKDLLQDRSFPSRLGLSSLGKAERCLADAVRWREEGGVGGDVGVVGVDEKILNLPNLVSISRMVSGPVIGWMIMQEWYLPAFGALIVSGATDWLDGFLARKMGINSVFGSYLDPLADKVLIGCVALAMTKKNLLNPILVDLVVLRDAGLVGGAVYKRASSLGWEWRSWSELTNFNATNREKVEPLFISKLNTVFQLLLVAVALLQPTLGTEETQVYITYLSLLVASTTAASAIAYGVQHFQR